MAKAPVEGHIIYDYVYVPGDNLDRIKAKADSARALLEQILSHPIQIDTSVDAKEREREALAQEHYRKLTRKVLTVGIGKFDSMTDNEAYEVLKLIQQAANADGPQPRDQETSHAA